MKLVIAAVAALAAASAAGTPASAQSTAVARLAAPTAAECQALQRAAQPALPRPLTRGSGRVEFFSGDFRAEGTGCTLHAEGNGLVFERSGDWSDRLSSRLRRAGWRLDEGMAADGAGTSVIGFRKGDLYLSVSTDTGFGGLCDEGQRSGVDCEREPRHATVTVDLGLARGPARR